MWIKELWKKVVTLKKSSTMNSKFLYILDPGHGGLDPDTGKYVTRGKRSPAFDDGSVLYEGVNNRDNVERVLEALTAKGIRAVNLVPTYRDIPLKERAQKVKELTRNNPCIGISFHSNAAPTWYIDKECTIRYSRREHGRISPGELYKKSKPEWNNARGISTYVYLKASKASNEFAELLQGNLAATFKNITNDRGIKKRNFAMLRETACPFVLIEAGFHTNKEEATEMLTEEWKDMYVNAIVKTIQEWEDAN